MRRWIGSAVALALSGAGSMALAQSYSYPNPGSYPNAGGWQRQGPDHALFERARADLDRAAGYLYASRADRRRFDDARRELFDFESRFNEGQYDRHILSRAIDRLESVVSRNSLDPRDRGALAEDLRRMRDYRDFRARNHGSFDGAFGYRP